MLCVIFVLLFVAMSNSIIINIGHVYYTLAEIPVMQMALEDLDEKGILATKYDFRYDEGLSKFLFHVDIFQSASNSKCRYSVMSTGDPFVGCTV